MSQRGILLQDSLSLHNLFKGDFSQQLLKVDPNIEERIFFPIGNPPFQHPQRLWVFWGWGKAHLTCSPLVHLSPSSCQSTATSPAVDWSMDVTTAVISWRKTEGSANISTYHVIEFSQVIDLFDGRNYLKKCFEMIHMATLLGSVGFDGWKPVWFQ